MDINGIIIILPPQNLTFPLNQPLYNISHIILSSLYLILGIFVLLSFILR